MGPEDEMLVPGDLDCYCNMVSFIWYVERKTSRFMCYIWGDSESESESCGLVWRGENIAQNATGRGNERELMLSRWVVLILIILV